MHKTLFTGVATALFAVAMGFGGNAAAASPYPATPCTAENDGQIATVSHWNTSTGYWAQMFQCDFGSWQLVGYCDRSGCIYY
jgi:hypothetical protein